MLDMFYADPVYNRAQAVVIYIAGICTPFAMLLAIIVATAVKHAARDSYRFLRWGNMPKRYRTWRYPYAVCHVVVVLLWDHFRAECGLIPSFELNPPNRRS